MGINNLQLQSFLVSTRFNAKSDNSFYDIFTTLCGYGVYAEQEMFEWLGNTGS